MKRWITGICLLIVPFISFSQNVSLSVIGSSTSACFGFAGGINDGNCWVNRVVSHFNANGFNVSLYNLAVSGYNAYQGMPNGSPGIEVNGQNYGPDINKNITKSLSYDPHVVIVNYPSNLYDVANVHDVLSWLRQIKKTANLAGKVCLVTTTQPRNFNQQGRDNLIELKDSILQQFGFYSINFWDNFANPDGSINNFYGQGDGVHLNGIAHDSMARRVIAKDIFNIRVNRSVASGNWQDPHVWDKGIVPSVTDSVVIKNGHAITLATTVEIRAMLVEPGGAIHIANSGVQLKIGNAANTRLPLKDEILARLSSTGK